MELVMIHVLHLGLSYACNMNCRHCFVKKEEDKLTTDSIKKTLTTLVNEFGLFIVYYTYGEPLFANNFYEIAEHANNLGLVQILMSNGSLITETEVEKIRKANISQVYISLDSASPNYHNSNRGLFGAHEKAISAIKLLSDASVNVGIATTLTESNVLELDELYNIAVNLNLHAFSLLRERNNGKIVKLANEHFYHSFVEKQLSTEAKCNLLMHDPTVIPFINSLYEKEKISLKVRDKYLTMNSCHCNTTLAITPSGDVSYCNLCAINVGNILTDDIRVILEKEDANGKKEGSLCCAHLSGSCV